MSKPIETRTEFQDLAEVRLEEAKGLLSLEKWDGAYYLAGYALELGLKACVIKRFADRFPPEKKFSEKCFTHDLESLVVLAQLSDARKVAMDSDQNFKLNWQTVKDWSEVKRYERITQAEAETIFSAIDDNAHGVFEWLKSMW